MSGRRSNCRRGLAVLLLAAVALAGCTHWRTPIDPTGQQMFVQSPIPPTPVSPVGIHPAQVQPDDEVAVMLTPHRMVAPVGSEVVLMAGVRAADGYLRTNRRLEWTLAPGSVGRFVDIERGRFVDFLVGDFTRPRIIAPNFAVGSTSRREEVVGQGTPDPSDDMKVLAGQGWIKLTSPVEGTSQVTVHAPEVVVAGARVQTATVYWIDAGFVYPPPSISPAGGRQTLTTAVLRQSNQQPHEGWIVRYEIAGGAAAGFGPEGAQAIEVPTNAAGQASAELIQQKATCGVTQIRILVLLPGDRVGAPGERSVVSTGSALATWTAAALVVQKSGPATVAVGDRATYRIEVRNSGDLPARGVVATDAVPEQMTLVSATPLPESQGRRLQWRLGDMTPGQQQQIEVVLQATRPGSVANCVEVAATGGARASHCVTTTILASGAPTPGTPTLAPPPTGPGSTTGMAAGLVVQIQSPSSVNVGQDATFHLKISNRSRTAVQDLVVRDILGDGLEHVTGKRIIQKVLGTMAPGQTQEFDVTLMATRAGQLCHTVEVIAPDRSVARAVGCVTAVDTGVRPPAGKLPGPKPPAGNSLSAQLRGPRQATVNELIQFKIDVTNITAQPLSDLRVVFEFDPPLKPEQATEGARLTGNTLVWNFTQLPPGGSTQLEVLCRCREAATKACGRITATTADGSRNGDEVCLEILGAPGTGPELVPGKLEIQVSDLENPIVSGEGVTYLIRVKNAGTAPESQVIVAAALPLGTTLDLSKTSGPSGTSAMPEGQTVRFTPLAQLAPGAEQVYRVRVRSSRPGPITLRAEVSSRGVSRPVVGEKTTDVISPR